MLNTQPRPDSTPRTLICNFPECTWPVIRETVLRMDENTPPLVLVASEAGCTQHVQHDNDGRGGLVTVGFLEHLYRAGSLTFTP